VQGSLDQPPIVLQAPRKGGTPVLILGLLLTAMGAVWIVGPRSAAGGAVTFALGLLTFFLGLMKLVAPAQLAIAPGGMELKGPFKTRRFGWDEVALFRVVALRRTRLIGFERTGSAARSGLLRDLGMAFLPANISSPYDSTIPARWSSASPEAVAQLLNDARARWGGVQEARALELRPRGSSGQRIDRRLYWLGVCVLVPTSIAGSFLVHGLRVSSGLTILWIWLYARRLHDIGRSAWWQAGVLAAAVVLGVVLGLLHVSVSAATVIGALVQLAFTAVLGAIPGDPDVNRFGPPPGAPPLEAAAEVFS
jgi:uncharacterized membrane protein YhaH (DUF805 family)